MKRSIRFIMAFLIVGMLYCPHAVANGEPAILGPYDWGTEGVASTDSVENILQLTPAADQWAEWVDWYNDGLLGEIGEPVVSWSWDLWPYSPSGSGNMRSQGDDWVPCWGVNPWSADGEWIIYTSTIPSYHWCDDLGNYGDYTEAAHHAICRIKPDGTDYEQLTSNEKGESQGSFLGNNDTIVFKRGPAIWKKDLLADDFLLLKSQIQNPGETNLTLAHRDEPGILHGDWAEDGEEPDRSCAVADDGDLKALVDGDGGQPAEGHPLPSPNGEKIAFARQGTVWVMDADGTNATFVAGKRVDIPVNSNLEFTPNGSGGFILSVPETFTWEGENADDLGAPLDICCGDAPEAEVNFENFSFPFAGDWYGMPNMTATLPAKTIAASFFYVSPNGHVSLGGSNYSADDSCNCGGPDKLLNGEYARIAPFWTHLARQLQIEGCDDDPVDCPDYAVYVNAFDGATPVPIVTYPEGEGCYGEEEVCNCEYDYFDHFEISPPMASGDPTVKETSPTYEIDRVVITWWNMKLIDNNKRLSIQLQLFDDGRILMGYKFDGTDDYEINSLKKVLIGLSPGHPAYENFDREDPETWITDPANPAGIDLTAVTAGGGYDSSVQADPWSIYELFYKVHGANKYTWSPNSEWLTFNGSPGCAVFTNIFEGYSGPCYGGKQRIFKVQADGYGLTMLSDLGEAGDYENNWPVWSPDGQWIAYHYHNKGDVLRAVPLVVEGEYALMRMSAVDGSGKEVVAAQGDFDGVCGPSSWSPDSEWVAFKRSMDIGYAIFMVNVDTGEEIQLTEGYDDARHWWSPVKGEILFREMTWGDTRDVGFDSDDLLLLTLSEEGIRGDVNGDDIIDKTDVYMLLALVGQTAPAGSLYDMDGDGKYTTADVKMLIAENPLLARDTRLRRLIR